MVYVSKFPVSIGLTISTSHSKFMMVGDGYCEIVHRDTNLILEVEYDKQASLHVDTCRAVSTLLQHADIVRFVAPPKFDYYRLSS